jgi:hypothetical protein
MQSMSGRILTLLFALIVSVSPMLAGNPAAPELLRYTVLSNGRTAGSEVDTYGPGGRIDCTFEYNDRGRGPKIAAHYILGADGLPLHADVTGNDYLKAPVDEHFAFENGVAHWKSTSENGQSLTPGFYVSNNGPVGEVRSSSLRS